MWAALNDTTIGPAVKDYCSGNPILKEQVMEKFGPILNWNTDSVTSMAGLFNNIDCQGEASPPIYFWNTEKVVSMRNMFSGSTFDGPLLYIWNVRNVKDMSNMFLGSSFNQPIGDWDTG